MSIAPGEGRPEPWRLGDLLALYGAFGLGALALLVAWWGASGTAVLSRDYAWLDLGIAGSVIIASGNGVWLLTGRRAVGERRLRALAAVQPLAVSSNGHVDPTNESRAATAADARPVASDLMARYHRPECQLVLGKEVTSATATAHERQGRRPCGICRP